MPEQANNDFGKLCDFTRIYKQKLHQAQKIAKKLKKKKIKLKYEKIFFLQNNTFNLQHLMFYNAETSCMICP